jgi:hypothetical protein
MSMNQMEQFLLNLPCLTHLTLDVIGSTDLADGHRWQRLSVGLIIFNFKFKVIVNNIQQMLDSFRTPFWIQEKRWYVAYHNGYLFSVPKFAPRDVFTSYNPQHFTGPNETFLYNNITKLNISVPIESIAHRFYHVKVLNFRCNTFDDKFLSLNKIIPRELTNPNSLNVIRLLLFYLPNMPHCHKLSLDAELTDDFIDKLTGNRFEQIRTLKIRCAIKITRYVIEGILRIFPRVECLHMSPIISNMDMIRLIDGFKYLSNAFFIVESKVTENELNRYHNLELSISGVPRLKNGTFTCRFSSPSVSSSSCPVNIWINTQVSPLI